MTTRNLPFSLNMTQSGQSSWGVGQTWKDIQIVTHVPGTNKNKGGQVLHDIWVHKHFQPFRFTRIRCEQAMLCCFQQKKKKAYFSLKISFSCSVQTFINCRALYTFIGSSIRPFMLINLTRLCSESYIMGGMTDSCLICFSLFCGREQTQR